MGRFLVRPRTRHNPSIENAGEPGAGGLDHAVLPQNIRCTKMDILQARGLFVSEEAAKVAWTDHSKESQNRSPNLPCNVKSTTLMRIRSSGKNESIS
jgi:hypothetical protein